MLKESTDIKLNWVKAVEQCLFNLGFGYVWLNGGHVSENSFIQLLKCRLRDCYLQEWHSKINESYRFTIYRSFKKVFEFESFLHYIIVKKCRDAYIRFSYRQHCTWGKQAK